MMFSSVFCRLQRADRRIFECISGAYATPQVYFVDETEAERFDRSFPPKKKEKLPGQLF